MDQEEEKIQDEVQVQEEKHEANLIEVPQANLVEVDIDIIEFKEIIRDITENDSVQSLKEHIQHIRSTRYEHCYEVAYYTYVITKKLGLDYISAARGAMLHDFYFYDWRNKGVEGQKHFHAYRHPRIALNNATEIFDLNDVEKDIILKHMWPLTFRLPRFTESFIVTLVDKYCATKEFFSHVKVYRKLRKLKRLNEANTEEENK